LEKRRSLSHAIASDGSAENGPEAGPSGPEMELSYASSFAAEALLQLLHRLIDREGCRALAGGEVLERLEELARERAPCEQVVAVDVDLVGLAADVHAFEQFVLHVRVARSGEERGEPIVTADDLVGDRTGLDVAWPADHARHAKGAFPIGGLLVAERRGAAVRPAVLVRTVVGGVEDDGVVSDAP